MKSRFFFSPALALLAASISSPANGSWTGWISDDMCGAKNAEAAGAECASRCVKEHGAKYVFVNDDDKKVYMVDAQDKVAPHAGHHVVVKGTVDGCALKLSSIEMAK
jgi:murein tripeptide amidase MpaA